MLQRMAVIRRRISQQLNKRVLLRVSVPRIVLVKFGSVLPDVDSDDLASLPPAYHFCVGGPYELLGLIAIYEIDNTRFEDYRYSVEHVWSSGVRLVGPESPADYV